MLTTEPMPTTTTSASFTVFVVYSNVILFPYDSIVRAVQKTEFAAITFGIVNNWSKDSPAAGLVGNRSS
jgi:hypothetical protein